MTELNKKFSLPKDEYILEDTMKRLEECNIINSKIHEEKDGPRIEEVYNCPCGDIVLNQKSIIGDIENPERGSIEIVHMKSDECSL
jgi:hypothetical protein